MHPLVKEKAGRKPFREVKTMKEDAAGVERMSEEIKARYSKCSAFEIALTNASGGKP